jgi:phosphatidate phosphatase PAH1
MKKYIIDIDGTICDKPKCRDDSDYETSIPKLDRIAKINKLYDEGNQIIYLTARGMGRSGDNTDLAKKMFYEITKNQLDYWGCKYHKLMLGKPSGDYYIDDKGINSDDFFKN